MQILKKKHLILHNPLICIRMKKLLLYLIAIFSFVLANAQERYEVISQSSLNIRSSASASSPVLGCVQSGATVDVYEIDGEWSKIEYNGRFAYVNNKYLKKCSAEDLVASSQNTNEEKVINSFLSQIDLEQYATYDVKWLIYVILGLSIVLAIVRKLLREDKGYLSNGQYIFNLIVFVLTCIVEIVYFVKMGMGNYTVWFCMPSDVGWIAAIVGFITLGLVVYNQVLCFIDTLMDIRYNAGDFDMRLGLYSWPIAVVAVVIMSFFDWDDSTMWILIILGVCQLIQIVLMIVGVSKNGGFFYSLLVIAIYIMGAISTMFILLQFLALFIIVAIVGFMGAAFLNSGSSHSSSPSESSSESSGSSDENSSGWQRGRLEYTDRFGGIDGHFSDDCTFHANGGGTYDKQDDGSWKKREW